MATIFDFPNPESATDQQEDMKLTADDKRWLSGEIKKQLADGLKEFGDSLKPHGWRKLTFWLREWGLAGTAIATPLALLGLLITVSIFAGVGIKENSRFQGSTEQRLNNIESQLRTLNASQNPGKVLKEIASLGPKQFAQNLPALRKVSEQPLADVSPAPDTLKRVAYQLKSVDETTEEYWPTVLKFIEFASAGLAPNAPPYNGKDGMYLTDVSGPGIKLPARSVFILGGRIANMTFVESRIVFTDKPVTFQNVTFVNCAFQFPTTDRPSPNLEMAGRALLDSDFKTASGE